MTWTKLGDEFSDECANTGLPDSAYRTHVEAIAWLYRVERMDLQIPKRLLPRFVGSEEWAAAVDTLVAIDYWKDRGTAYEVVHHADVIRSSIVAQQSKRSRDKKASAAFRRRSGGPTEQDNVSADTSDDVSADADRQTDIQAALKPSHLQAGDNWPTPAPIPRRSHSSSS